MRVLITGATGLIGQNIVNSCLENTISVSFLSTQKSKLNSLPGAKGFYWNPNKNEINTNCLEAVDAIIHLVGSSISKPWTKAHKASILNSRIKSTILLYQTLKNNEHQVKHIISASAIGIYPNSLTKYYNEDETTMSPSFLGKVVQQWEAEVDRFSQLDIRLSKIRLGLVFSSKLGAFPQMVKPVSLGLGSAMGSGKQWVSWIHITDVSGLFIFVLQNKLEGVFNAVAPNPETNSALIKAIASRLKRPLILPNIPKGIMTLILGERAMLLFESQRVSAKKIEEAGFQFKYHNLSSALEELL